VSERRHTFVTSLVKAVTVFREAPKGTDAASSIRQLQAVRDSFDYPAWRKGVETAAITIASAATARNSAFRGEPLHTVTALVGFGGGGDAAAARAAVAPAGALQQRPGHQEADRELQVFRRVPPIPGPSG
jgi:hypothetical protein